MLSDLAESRCFIAISAIAASLTLGYDVALDLLGDPRMADGVLDGNEAYLWEMALFSFAPLCVAVTVFAAVAHAWKQSRRKWAAMVLLIWPLAFIYCILLNTRWVDE